MDYQKLIEEVQSPDGKYNGREIEYLLKALNSENSDCRAISWVQKFEESFSKNRK